MRGRDKLVHCVHRRLARVGREAHLRVVGAAEGSTEVRVQMGQERAADNHASINNTRLQKRFYVLLVRAVRVGGHVAHERGGSSAIEEVDARRAAVPVSAVEGTRKVGNEVDGGSVVCGVGGENTGDGILVGLRVVADDGGVHEQGEESVLGRRVADVQQRGRVVVTRGWRAG